VQVTTAAFETTLFHLLCHRFLALSTFPAPISFATRVLHPSIIASIKHPHCMYKNNVHNVCREKLKLQKQFR